MKICPLCEKEFGDQISVCPDDGADVMPLIADPLIGSIIEDRYRITDVIGVGSMGVVYRAVQEAVSREVAIKILPRELASNRQAVKRFHHEAKAASRLNHPHIITVYDFGIAAGGEPFIAMELLDGITMNRYLVERKRLELFEALPIIQQMCDAIGEAHTQGLIHRDIKPANIALVERGGRKNHVIILDFGIAKGTERINDPDSTAPGVVFGSPVYMSPERFLGQSGDVRSDIYSLGVVIFQMLSGAVPFKSTDLINLISSHVIATPPTVSSITSEATIPAAMEQVLQRALSKSPGDRPQSMREFWEDIHRACKPWAPSSNTVPESGVRHLDPADNAATHDVFKRLEGLLSDSPVAAMAAGSAGRSQAPEPAAEGSDAVATASAPNSARASSGDAPAAAQESSGVPASAAQAASSGAAAAEEETAAGTKPSLAAGAAPLRPRRSEKPTSGQPQLAGSAPGAPVQVGTAESNAPQQAGPAAVPAADRGPAMVPGWALASRGTRGQGAGSAGVREPGSSSGKKLESGKRSGGTRLPSQYKNNAEQDTTPSGRFSAPSFASGSADSASSHGVLISLLVIGVLLAGAAIWGIFVTQPQPSPEYVQSLLYEGKLDDAGHVLALLRNDRRGDDGEAMDQLSMSLAREYVRINRLPAAIQSLQQIPPDSSQYETAQVLIKKYRDKLGI
jgi:serine/threonine-protein kinase